MWIGIGTRHIGVVGADHFRLASANFTLKRACVDAAREPLRQGKIETGEFAGPSRDAIDRRLVDDPAHQIDEIIARRVILHVLQRFPRDGFATGERRCRHGRQARRIDPRRDRGLLHPVEIEDRRDQHEAAQSDSEIALEFLRHQRPTEAAIAFTREEFRRAKAVFLLQPAHDEGRESVDVALDRVKALAHLIAANDPAIAGAGRIDEHEIGEIEPGLAVRQQRRRCRRADARTSERQPPRADGEQVEIGRGGAGAAIDREGHGPRCRVFVVAQIGHEAIFRLRRALRIRQRQAAGDRREFDGAPRQFDGVPRHRFRRQPSLTLGAWAPGLLPLGRLLRPLFFLSERKRRACEGKGDACDGGQTSGERARSTG